MTDSAADRLVVQTVRTIRDRFGVDGLRDLVAQATRELHDAQRVADQGVSSSRAWPDSAGDMADTQAWIAFTDEPSER